MIGVVIPVFNPEHALIEYVQNILKNPLRPVIIINDGSDSAHSEVFCRLSSLEDCIVLTHETSRGKGRALKTAYEYFLANLPQHIGLITADADGSNALEDILALAELLCKNPDRYAVVGQRDIYNKKVPLLSRLGNKMNAALFRLLYGGHIKDTQCGLRAFSADIITDMLKISGERYDYEMRVLTFLQLKNITWTLYPIQTIYSNNKRPDYRPADTARIFISLMSGFFRYFSVFLLSAIIDVFVLALCYYFFFSSLPLAQRLLLSTVIARIISSVFNYLANKFVVFQSKKSHRKAAWRYYFLWLSQMLTSYFLVLLCTSIFSINVVLPKALIDTALGIISYQVQLHWVFKDAPSSSNKPKP